MSKTIKSEKVPKLMQPIFDSIVSLTDSFSKKHLNEEYAQMIRYTTAALCRQRPSHLNSGRINTWACGIVYAVGFVNFLFDKSQEPYMSASNLCDDFGVSKSTGRSKSKIVKDELGMFQFDPNWCLPSKMNENPMAWLISVNGVIVDARYIPRHLQDAAFEKGLIPYIPDSENAKR